MSSATVEAYLAGVDGRAGPLVRSLDRVIMTTDPGFEIAVKYRILMYTLAGDWRTWVCAIDTTRKGVCLRFLYGVLLDDPRGVLRAGSSVLKTWDFDFDEAIEPEAVGAYVAEAVARYGEYKANTTAVLEASRTAGRAGRTTPSRQAPGGAGRSGPARG